MKNKTTSPQRVEKLGVRKMKARVLPHPHLRHTWLPHTAPPPTRQNSGKSCLGMLTDWTHETRLPCRRSAQ